MYLFIYLFEVNEPNEPLVWHGTYLTSTWFVPSLHSVPARLLIGPGPGPGPPPSWKSRTDLNGALWWLTEPDEMSSPVWVLLCVTSALLASGTLGHLGSHSRQIHALHPSVPQEQQPKPRAETFHGGDVAQMTRERRRRSTITHGKMTSISQFKGCFARQNKIFKFLMKLFKKNHKLKQNGILLFPCSA